MTIKHLISSIAALFCLGIIYSQTLPVDRWTYMEIDSTRDLMNPMDGPDWLRSFGIDAIDINMDGYKDIVAGKYFYLNPGGDMEAPWKRTEFGFAYDGYKFVDVDGDQLADIIAEDLPNVVWLEADDLNGSSWSARLVGHAPKTGHKNGQGSGIADILPGGKQEILLAAEGGIYCAVIPEAPSTKLWDFHLIAESNSDEGIGIGNIDGDGDTDIVFGGEGQSNQVWWWENPYPKLDPEKPWQRHIIKDSGANKHHDQLFGDYDGDGVMELVFWNQSGGKLFLAEIPEKPARYKGERPMKVICKYYMDSEMEQTGQEGYTGWKSTDEHEGLFATDIDGDGIDDIVGGGRWFKYDGQGGFQENIIDASYTFTRSVAGQFVEGGRPELILLAGDGHSPMYMYEYNEQGTWKKTMLIQQVIDGHTIDVLDFNGDGHLDIFSGEMGLNGGNPDAKIRILLGDGKGHFVHHVVATGIGTHESKIADLDGDGDYDILSKPYTWKAPRLDLFINETK